MDANGRDAIADLVHRYCDAVCRYDVAAFADTWASDGVWDIGRGPTEGRDAVVEAFTTAMGLFDSVIQVLNNGSADVDGETGTGRWYMTEYSRTKTGRNLLYLGAYDDTYVCQDGVWRFSSRHLSWYYQGAPDLTGTFGPPPGYQDHR